MKLKIVHKETHEEYELPKWSDDQLYVEPSTGDVYLVEHDYYEGLDLFKKDDYKAIYEDNLGEWFDC